MTFFLFFWIGKDLWADRRSASKGASGYLGRRSEVSTKSCESFGAGGTYRPETLYVEVRVNGTAGSATVVWRERGRKLMKKVLLAVPSAVDLGRSARHRSQGQFLPKVR